MTSPLSAALAERYSRQTLFADIGVEGQRALAGAAVAIVGCGALGSAQAELLARAGVGQLRIIDRDYVDAGNLQRQTLFDERDAAEGLPKAVAAARRLRAVNSEIEVEERIADLTPETAATLLAGAALLLDGTDNRETRYLLNDYAVQASVPWVYGAVVAARGASFFIVPGETACLTCLFGGEPGASPADGETCDTAGVLAWAVSVTAALQVSEAVKWLVGARAALRGSLVGFDLWSNRWRELRQPRRDPDCRTCGRRDFVHLRGEGRAAITLCGRNAVQVHERRRACDLTVLAERLRPQGEVKANPFALRFAPRHSAGVEMTVFPDGRALIKGTTDAGVARSLYARYIGS